MPSKRSASILLEPSNDTLWSTKSHFRQTRRGKILKTVQENYLRDDIFFGTQISTTGGGAGGDPTSITNTSELIHLLLRPWVIVVVDTNVLLHNMDLLEHAAYREACPNIVIPQTALMECKRHSMPAYERAVDLLKESQRCAIFFPNEHHAECQLSSEVKFETDNDRNDGLIRLVAEYFGVHVRDHSESDVKVILLSDDKGCRKLAVEEQLERFGVMESELLYDVRSVKNHVEYLERENKSISLKDLVARFETKRNIGGEIEMYPEHVDLKEIMVGVKAGRYFQGILRCERGSHTRGYVNIRRGDDRIAVSITKLEDFNRAVDGDSVAIKLHSIDKWLVPDIIQDMPKKDSGSVGIASDTAEPSIRDENNVDDTIALHSSESDNVLVRRPTGIVVGIIRRQFHRDFCGSIYTRNVSNFSENKDEKIKDSEAIVIRSERDEIAQKHEVEHPDGTTTCAFFAADNRIPPILIRTTQRHRLIGHRIVVSIDSWPRNSEYPLGHFVRSIGLNGTKDVETEVLLHEHNIPCEPFSAKVLACLPPENYQIKWDPKSERKDLRHLPVLSIDPPGCKDIDDALHCIKLGNGNLQIGVHIADVTHYVEAGSPLDIEASNRSTSTYLVARRLDMLPSLLTTDLCSLKGNVDRFAFSVLWEVTSEGKIVDVNFHKSIIHSIAALTYEQAQALIDEPDENSKEIKCGAVKRLASIARILRQRRIDAGALTLASPEVKFVLDSESLNPIDCQSYTLFEANAVVEEFMLLANVTVGKKILRHYPTLSILRRHPAPNKAMFDSLISKARSRGFDINIDDSKRLADSLDAAVIQGDPYFNKLLRIMSTRCMSPAQYFCSGEYRPQEWHHYGLAAPVYTHFTSPIRRYADVIVHRLLAAAIGVAPLPVHLSSKRYLHDLASNMNRRHRAAQLAGRASVQLHTLIFFNGDAGKKEMDAYILDIDFPDNGKLSMRVIVPRYGIEGKVGIPVDSNNKLLVRKPDEHWVGYSNENGKIVSSLQVFQKITVCIWVREVFDGRELVIDLVSPKFGS